MKKCQAETRDLQLYLKRYSGADVFSSQMLHNFLSAQSWTKQLRQILEIKQKLVFLRNGLEVIFYNFLAQLTKFPFQVFSRALPLNYKQFRNLPEISLSRLATREATRTLHLC